MKNTKNHPVQPLEKDQKGVLRFKPNQIVCYLLDKGPYDLNQIAGLNFSGEDEQQFAQLIGYSLSGYGSLFYVNQYAYDVAVEQTSSEKEELHNRIAILEEKIQNIKNDLREPMADLFEICSEDLK